MQKICLVLGSDVEPFEDFLATHKKLTICIQNHPKGTADAVASAAFAFEGTTPADYCSGAFHSGPKLNQKYVLIGYGDTPCIPSSLLLDFVQKSIDQDADMALIVMDHPNPEGYGRVLLDAQGRFDRIVEEKDANEFEKTITLCNSGVVFAKTETLFDALVKVSNQNAQKEYYLTDTFDLAKQSQKDVFIYKTSNFQAFNGVNTKEQLANLERWFRNQKVQS